MKPGLVTKLDKRRKNPSKKKKKIDDNVISEKCDIIVIILICGQFGVIRKPDSGCIFYKYYVFINSNFLSYKN